MLAYSSFHGQEISLAVAKEALRDLLAVQNRQVSIENIQKTVADYYKIRISDMHSKKRSRAIARPRQVAMALAKELTQLSLPEIGSNFGGRDHTTVLHACRQIAKLRDTHSRTQSRRQFPAAGAAQLSDCASPEAGDGLPEPLPASLGRPGFAPVWKRAPFRVYNLLIKPGWPKVAKHIPKTTPRANRRYPQACRSTPTR